MTNRLKRQGFLGPTSAHTLENCSIGVVGLGGGGSHIVQQLAHVGVGNFVIVDPDIVEETNLNRLVGATHEDVRLSTLKTHVARRVIRGVNPRANVSTIANPWQEAAESLRECDVIFGCLDTFRARSELETMARRYLIPYIDIGMDVHQLADHFAIGGQVILSMPGRPCLRCVGYLNDDLLREEAQRYGAAGGRPQVIWPNGLLASLAVGIFMQLVTPWHKQSPDVEFLEYDGNRNVVAKSNRLSYVTPLSCRHFADAENLGDPFWAASDSLSISFQDVEFWPTKMQKFLQRLKNIGRLLRSR